MGIEGRIMGLNNSEATTPLAKKRQLPARGAAFERGLNWPSGHTGSIKEKLSLVLNKKLLTYLGPGFIVTVGFIDPGNWATNMAGGAEFNYSLLWVITLSTVMLILLQHMSARLGAVTGKSLAENIREHFPKPWANFFAATIFIACVATALAEYLGGALGLNILFGLPLWAGSLLTFIMVAVLIVFQCYLKVERLILAFLAIIAGSYVLEIFITQPDWAQALPRTVLPSVNSQSIIVAVGMLGAVVMSHNIYLHSSTIQSRDWSGSDVKKRELLRFEFIDTVLAMGLGWLVNSSMVLVAAAVFYTTNTKVISLEQAAATLKPLAGEFAGLVFAVALLFCGVGSSITASLASGNIVSGYMAKDSASKPFWFRLGVVALTLPALLIIALNLNSYQVLILSQVVLSIMLPFTIIPLLILVKNSRIMGCFASGRVEFFLACITAAVVILLNVLLLYQTFGGTFAL